MKKTNISANILIKIVIALLFGLICFLDGFQKMDYRLYDAMLHIKKDPQINENIMIVKIDDPSILALGEWPWSRDVIADALLRMKELGSDSAIFDIEYISPSKNGIAPSAEENIISNVNLTEDIVMQLVEQFVSAVESGLYSKDEISQLANNLLGENIAPNFIELVEYITNNIARDNDDYFARALQFFGKSYLTINHQDLGYNFTDEEVDYANKRFLIKSVNDKSYLINIGNDFTCKESNEPKGFTPALHSILTRTYGANFTNSVVDNDGVRRRMEPLFVYGDNYLPQLVFGPYLDIVQSKDILRQKDELIVRSAKNPITGEINDVKIPLDPHGRILVHYVRGSVDDTFKTDSIINLLNLDLIEEQIILCINNIYNQAILDSEGFQMTYTLAAENLLTQYEAITLMKKTLLSKCSGYDENGKVLDGISEDDYKEYFNLRTTFYNGIKIFLEQNYLDDIFERLFELEKIADLESIEELRNYLQEDFEFLKYEYDAYNSYITEMKPLYENTYCIIGNTATSTTDTGATPFERKFMNVGIHANLLNTLLTEDFIIQIRWQIGFLLAFCLSLLMLLFVKSSHVKQNVISFCGYLIFVVIFGLLFLYKNIYIQFFGILIYLLVDYLVNVAYRFYQSFKEKQFITQIAASFANKDTVDELRKNPDAFKTEGQKKYITALFSDIQKFSTLSESIGKLYGEEGPNKLIEILNEYLGKMSNEILINHGNIDKYEGDAIISMFGAPDLSNSHTKEEWAFLCLESAIRMKDVEVEFNKVHEDLFVPKQIVTEKGNEIIKLNPLQTRIGVNSGEAFVGLMGSKTESFSKLNYTMIGDTVNLAARLEGVNKAYGTWIMCSDVTWHYANSGIHTNELTARKLDRVRVVGRSTPVQLYNVIGRTKDLSRNQKEQIEIFNAAMDKFLERDFVNAGKLFVQTNQIGNGDATSLIFAERCRNFIKTGIPKDWDGVVNMESK